MEVPFFSEVENRAPTCTVLFFSQKINITTEHFAFHLMAFPKNFNYQDLFTPAVFCQKKKNNIEQL